MYVRPIKFEELVKWLLDNTDVDAAGVDNLAQLLVDEFDMVTEFRNL